MKHFFIISIIALFILSTNAQDHKDPYSVLGCKKGDSQKQIKRAFRQLSLKYHPDKNPEGIQKFKEILSAYQLLKQNNFKYEPSRHFHQNFGRDRHHFEDMQSWNNFEHFYGQDFQDGFYYEVHYSSGSDDFDKAFHSAFNQQFFQQIMREFSNMQDIDSLNKQPYSIWDWIYGNLRIYLAVILFIIILIMIFVQY